MKMTTAMIGNRYLSMLSAPIWSPSSVAQGRHADRPEQPADDVVHEERAVLHLSDARKHRYEGPHDGDEAGEEDRLGAVGLEELVGPLDVLLLEELRVRLPEDRGPDLFAERVPDLVSDDGGEEAADEDDRKVEVDLGPRRARR